MILAGLTVNIPQHLQFHDFQNRLHMQSVLFIYKIYINYIINS